MGLLRFCTFERDKDSMVIRLTNPNMICASGELQLDLSYLIDRYRPRVVQIDFSNITYCSREAINDLLTARRRILERGGVFQIFGMSPRVRTKFRSLRLDGHVFDISGSEPSGQDNGDDDESGLEPSIVTANSTASIVAANVVHAN